MFKVQVKKRSFWTLFCFYTFVLFLVSFVLGLAEQAWKLKTLTIPPNTADLLGVAVTTALLLAWFDKD
jgi:hypothetical protein